MLQDGLQKVLKGLTTFEEILKIIELDDDEHVEENSDLKAAIMNANMAFDNKIEEETLEPTPMTPPSSTTYNPSNEIETL